MPDVNAQYRDPTRGDWPTALPESHQRAEQPDIEHFSPPGGLLAQDYEGYPCRWEGPKLAAVMRSRGMSQRALAAQVGVAQPTIQRWCDPIDSSAPTVDFILKLTQVLGVHHLAFFTRDNRLAGMIDGIRAQSAHGNGQA